MRFWKWWDGLAVWVRRVVVVGLFVGSVWFLSWLMTVIGWTIYFVQ